MRFRTRRFAREHRNARLVRLIARQCEKILHGFYNQGFYELEHNGEARVIETVAGARPDAPLFVLDVGANRGEWAKVVLARRPDANVYCFEIVPEVAAALGDALAGHPTAHACDYGLSSAAQDVEVLWNPASDHISAIVPRHADPPPAGLEGTMVACKVDTGDAVTERFALPRIDLLKIDVEGHEIEVLRGFGRTLESGERRPRVIQFEYGTTWLPARHILQDAYRLLEPFGYVVGRLYPDGVDFKPYAFADDHFRMGNYIAAGAQDALTAKLARFGA